MIKYVMPVDVWFKVHHRVGQSLSNIGICPSIRATIDYISKEYKLHYVTNCEDGYIHYSEDERLLTMFLLRWT